MQSLFPNSRASGGDSALVSFNVGKCELSGPNANGKFQVTPDGRKGKLILERGRDGLVLFIWTDRGSGQVIDERVIFPNETTFKRIKTGTETDRVYALSFPANRQYFVYWMQDKSSEKDEDNCKKFNDFANNPAAAGRLTKFDDW